VIDRTDRQEVLPRPGSRGWEGHYQRTRRNLKVRRRRIEAFDLNRDSRVLDYGCGDGLDLRCFLELGYHRAIGIDASEALLRQAPQDRVVLGDCEQTPFADATFDAVFVNAVLHHLDFGRSLAEIRRILRPSGMLCLIEQRRGWPRRLLDLVTFSPLGAVLPVDQIRHRRAALLFETAEYAAWLRRQPRIVTDLASLGFEVVYRQSTLLSILLRCRRLGD
jgi:SAM-dependent methyltransferase